GWLGFVYKLMIKTSPSNINKEYKRGYNMQNNEKTNIIKLFKRLFEGYILISFIAILIFSLLFITLLLI
ncbi:MAG: hypothetical protein K1W17_12600, partial [Oscillospiraceae bacterium]